LRGTAQASLDNASALEQLHSAADTAKSGNGNKSAGEGRTVPEPRYPTTRQHVKMACRGSKAFRVRPACLLFGGRVVLCIRVCFVYEYWPIYIQVEEGCVADSIF
jgi:hypothetical protein